MRWQRDTTVGNTQYENLTPQLTITADGSDPESAQRSVKALVEFARTILPGNFAGQERPSAKCGVGHRSLLALRPRSPINLTEG